MFNLTETRTLALPLKMRLLCRTTARPRCWRRLSGSEARWQRSRMPPQKVVPEKPPRPPRFWHSLAPLRLLLWCSRFIVEGWGWVWHPCPTAAATLSQTEGHYSLLLGTCEARASSGPVIATNEIVLFLLVCFKAGLPPVGFRGILWPWTAVCTDAHVARASKGPHIGT